MGEEFHAECSTSFDVPSGNGGEGAVAPVRSNDRGSEDRLWPVKVVPELPEWTVRARRVLDDERILDEVGSGTRESARVLSLRRTVVTQARMRAHELSQLTTFFAEDPDTLNRREDMDVTAVKVAAALRVSAKQAWSMVRDAVTAVRIMPLTFEYLRRGELTEQMHTSMLRRVRRLTEEECALVDAHLATVELPSVSDSTFRAQLTLAIELATAGALPTPPRLLRNVELVEVSPEKGTASLYVTGPIPEIQGLAHRLDVAARTVQKAQRAMLERGEEGPLPFDLDGDAAAAGRSMSLAALRYGILTHSLLDLDPVQEPTSPYKLLVTVPVMTLLGRDDAPAMIEGTTPLPAELARELAAGAPTWQRILTDPVTGAYLPAAADTYQPTAQMRLQLRIRHPLCAVPGCTMRTALAAEDDHIEEYDHEHPDRGGQTSLENLHRLCWRHHQLKTARALDPAREPGPGPGRGPLETTWEIAGEVRTRTREHTDLLTPHTAALLEELWTEHEACAAEARRRYDEDAARPRPQRVAEDRAATLARARGQRILPTGVTHPGADLGPPPF